MCDKISQAGHTQRTFCVCLSSASWSFWHTGAGNSHNFVAHVFSTYVSLYMLQIVAPIYDYSSKFDLIALRTAP